MLVRLVFRAAILAAASSLVALQLQDKHARRATPTADAAAAAAATATTPYPRGRVGGGAASQGAANVSHAATATTKLAVGVVLAETNIVAVALMIACGVPSPVYLGVMLFFYTASVAKAVHQSTDLPVHWSLLVVALGWCARVGTWPMYRDGLEAMLAPLTQPG